MRDLKLHHLEAGEIDKAFVLARLGYRYLTLDAWRSMALATLDAGSSAGSILMAQDKAARAKGLLIYAILPTVAGRPCLRVERLIAFDLLDPKPIADALVSEVLGIAVAQKCESFSLVAPLDAPASTTAMVMASSVSIFHQVF